MMTKQHKALVCFFSPSAQIRNKVAFLYIFFIHIRNRLLRPKSIQLKNNNHQTQKSIPLGSRPADRLQDGTWLFFAKWRTPHSAKSSLTKIRHCWQKGENIYKILCVQRHLRSEPAQYTVGTRSVTECT